MPPAAASPTPAASLPSSANVAEAPAATLPDNGPRPGYYAVKPGDTIMRIALDNGQSWRDLVKWNGLENPNVIEVGQLIRVVPPGADPAVATTRPVTLARVETRALTPVASAASGVATPAPPAPASAPVVTPAAAASAAPPSSAPAATTPASTAVNSTGSASREGDEEIRWGWPATGAVQLPFEDGKVKGLVIGGKAGDPVVAAADGRVVYAGSGLRGYGNLVILKHNATYLTAYAHNQSLLVKEDQNVRRGQKIAEMGSTDADGVQLHFEIRRQGKPIDPAKLLPPR